MPTMAQAISGLLKEYGLEQAVQAHQAIVLWDDVVGAPIAAACKAVDIVRGTLIVKARNPAWRGELDFQKNRIIQALNARIGSPVVTKIQIR